MRRGLVVIVLVVAAIEAAALAHYAWMTGALYYSDTPHAPSFHPDGQKSAHQYRLDPYMGYVHVPYGTVPEPTMPWASWSTNSEGLLGPQDFPVTPHPDGLVIAILGGSFARDVAVHNQAHRILQKTLATSLGMEPERIQILALALGAWKQPQPLHALTKALLDGQHVDAVVLLDGFNEVVMALENAASGVSVTEPSLFIMRGLAERTPGDLKSPAYLRLKLDVAAHLRAAEFASDAAWSREGSLTMLATGFTYHQLRATWHTSRAEALHVEALQSAPDHGIDSLILLETKPGLSPDAAMAAAITAWDHAATLTQTTAEAFEAAFIHRLQPTPHDAGAVTAPPTAPSMRFASWVPKAYTQMIDRRGPEVAALLNVFEGFPGTPFRDQCCHLTRNALDHYAEALAETIAHALMARSGSP